LSFTYSFASMIETARIAVIPVDGIISAAFPGVAIPQYQHRHLLPYQILSVMVSTIDHVAVGETEPARIAIM
ncbi:hypothetical protein TorRG33x02_355860, partial [Trema orientale]